MIEHKEGAYLGQTNIQHEMHGKGSYISQEGSIYEGYFKNDQIVYGRKIAEKSVIEGQFKDGKAHGSCVQTLSSGDKHVGEYAQGKKHGFVTIFRPDGTTYEVTYCQGRKHGTERKIAKDGTVTEAEFEMDVQRSSKRVVEE